MLSAILLSVALGPALLEPAPDLEPSARIEVLARVRPGSFLAINPSGRAQWLLFGDPLGTVRASVVLAPGGDFESRFPVGLLDTLALEVLSNGPEGLVSSGAHSLAALRDGDFDSILVETTPRGTLTWGQDETGTKLLTAQCDLSGVSTFGASAARPTHVPVVTPAGKKTGDRPPRMGKKPLPPL